jgi:hypothetical protein
MEFFDLAQERMNDRDRELAQMQLVSEARRLGAARARGPLATLDGFIIRASRGATARQARREYPSNPQGLVS